MKISYIDYIEDLKGTKYPTASELFDGIKEKLKALPFKPDAVVFASVSLYSEFMYLYGHDIAHTLNLNREDEIYHLTGGCFVALQALQIADALGAQKKSINHILVVTIDFLTGIIGQDTIKKRASAVRWGNGASLALVSRNADGLSLLDFESQTDHAWYDDFSIRFSGDVCAQQLNFKLDSKQYSNDFGKEDLHSATKLLRLLLTRNDVQKLNGLVSLNRGGSFTQKLATNLEVPSSGVFESFNDRGHLGCSDLFMNLSDFVKGKAPSGHSILYSCGYGYTRVAALISRQ